MKTEITLLFFLLLVFKIPAQVLNVPAQFATIQAAINASQNGDTVLVQPGDYFENVRFHGKSIVLTSRFFQTNSAADIAATILNGSQPTHPDTASCILIVDGEDASTVVQGFILTGGNGTKWLDPHGAGTYREGGAILTQGTSPTIQFNIIRNNSITVTGPGVTSTGGGGIRSDGGSPVIRNNWIHHNHANGYGGGIVLNYCGGQVFNNVVTHNTGGQNFGGGGLWLNGENVNTVVEVFNNTVAFNHSSGSGTYGGKGGGLFVFSIKALTSNNIFWGNTQSTGSVFANFGGQILATYSDIQGNFTGLGNFDLDPLFVDTSSFTLRWLSPCVDAGDPNSNDLTLNGFDAIFPSLCSPFGDIGAFGGPWASTLPNGVQPGRLFEKITDGPQVTTPSDSRSVNFVDVNNDGWDDLFISNGPQAGAVNFLYLNDGTGNFTAVVGDPIVSDSKPFDGATFADADNDGDLDAYVVTWYGQKNFLYFGNSDSTGASGTFTYDGNAAPSNIGTYSETASWGDYDNDGLLDLYVTNSDGTFKNLLFHNDGDHVFSQVTTGAHVNDANASRSVNWVDFDDDCDLDIFVSNESNQPDDLYKNNGDGTFTKVTSGAPSQSARSTMSSSWGDVDNDGDLDLFVANSGFFAPQNNQLFKNNGNPTGAGSTFTEVTTGPLVTDGGCSYGSSFGDYDNDGDLDLVVSNGFCNGNIVNFLYQNDGQGNFSRDLTSAEDLATPCSYGTAWGDVNNDGFLDLGIATCKNTSAAPLPVNLFYLNKTNCNNWLKIQLNGTLVNRSAIGARVWVTATIGGQSVTQMREISAQSGYCGQNSLTAHFGLGDAENVTEVRVRFGCEEDATLTNIAPNQLLETTEGSLPSATQAVENEAFTVTVSPNPTSDTFRVSVEMKQPSEQLQMRLMDNAGRVVFEKKVDTNRSWNWSEDFSTKITGLVKGRYFVEVRVGEELKTETVIIF